MSKKHTLTSALQIFKNILENKMRIKFFYKILYLSFLVLAQAASAQSMPFSINLSITPANFNITDLVVNKNLSGTPRIVELTMSESGRLIVLEGEISWDENTTGDFQTMYSFTTKPFESRLRLANNDINNFDDIE
ncbi:MAG: hypothetical protein JW857_11265, partial [Bacteroidales bacterium]|nr:hypothetical protein [Bacteroidales bacterium]